MANLLALPTLEADFLGPLRTPVDVLGSSQDGGRNGLGEGIEIEMSGGGALTCTYESCKIQQPEHFEYINWLGARFNGGFRFLNVPIITDWWGLFPKIGKLPAPLINGIPHSDGSMFSDGAGYSQASVYGELVEDAALNAGVIKMRLYGASRRIRWSDWFSIYHLSKKGWRAYRNWDVLSVTDESSPVYALAISPPLREATPAGTRIEFARPRFAAKFKTGFTLPSISEAFYAIEQNIQFSEAF